MESCKTRPGNGGAAKSCAYILGEFLSAFGSRTRALPDWSRVGAGVFILFNRDGSDGENRENMDRRSWVVRNNTLLA
jgi:hypothetical protein